MSINVELQHAEWRDYYELTKPKVVMLIVFTAVVGMFLSVPGWPGLNALVFGTLGIGLAASSAAVFNHVLDARIDIHMLRTQARPLPQGRLSEAAALRFASVLSVISMIMLWFFVNPLTAVLTFFSPTCLLSLLYNCESTANFPTVPCPDPLPLTFPPIP